METKWRQESEIENQYPSQAILLSFVFNWLLKRCFKESIISLIFHSKDVLKSKL